MSPASIVVSAVLALPWVFELSAATTDTRPTVLTSARNGVQVIEQKGYRWHSGDADLRGDVRLPSLAASRDSVGSLTSAEGMDHRMQHGIGRSWILR